jgi:manganese transport system ATP-binding protein
VIDAVEVRDLRLVHGAHVALDDTTFSCRSGTSVAIVGPNGSGKSTLLNALGGLHAPAAGSVRVLDRLPTAARSRMAYVLQSNAVNEHLPATVEEVVSMARYARRGPWAPLRSDDRAAIATAMEHMEVSQLGRRHLGELSGGQRQRVFVAQGLAQQADVLLLDEPVTGLDMVSRRVILDALAGERERGRTVLMTTHDLSEAADADQVLLLAGRLVAAGPPGSVLTSGHLRDAYGGRLVHLDDGTSVIDDPHHHAQGDDHTGHDHSSSGPDD